MKKWTRFFFLLYGALMICLLFDRRGAVEGVPYWEQVQRNMNLEPFHTIGNYWHILTHRDYYVAKWEAASIYFYHARIAVINLVGNVIMFVPLGYFIPAVWKKWRTFFRCLFCAVGMILAVEIAQLFTLLGSCDIDDLILNLVGVTLGYIFYAMTYKKRKRKKK